MTGTIKKTFPKPGHKGTFIVLIEVKGEPDIYEEMNGVADKSELPEIGTEVELVRSFPTWKMA